MTSRSNLVPTGGLFNGLFGLLVPPRGDQPSRRFRQDEVEEQQRKDGNRAGDLERLPVPDADGHEAEDGLADGERGLDHVADESLPLVADQLDAQPEWNQECSLGS